MQRDNSTTIVARDYVSQTGANANYVTVQHVYNTAPPAAEMRVVWPVTVGRMPETADQYIDRPTLCRGEALTQVLIGSGGYGKSQLAAHNARQQLGAGKIDLLIWVDAGSRSSVLAAYAQAAIELGLPNVGERENGERAAQVMKQWLATTEHPWLVVLDNIMNPADVAGW